jgi:hypothetical protein
VLVGVVNKYHLSRAFQRALPEIEKQLVVLKYVIGTQGSIFRKLLKEVKVNAKRNSMNGEWSQRSVVAPCVYGVTLLSS